jgi:hypothetical protein
LRSNHAKPTLADLAIAVLAVVPGFFLGKLVIRLHHGPVPMSIALVATAVGFVGFVIAWGRQPLWIPSYPVQVVADFLLVFGGMLLLTR